MISSSPTDTHRFSMPSRRTRRGCPSRHLGVPARDGTTAHGRSSAARAHSRGRAVSAIPFALTRARSGRALLDRRTVTSTIWRVDPTRRRPKRSGCSARSGIAQRWRPAAERRAGDWRNLHAARKCGRSATSTSRCSRPSPTRRSSRSRTCACSTRRRRRSSGRRRPPRSCASSRARPPTCSRCSTTIVKSGLNALPGATVVVALLDDERVRIAAVATANDCGRGRDSFCLPKSPGVNTCTRSRSWTGA